VVRFLGLWWLGGSGWAMDFGLDSVRFSFSLAFDFG
jgi:hypothetical protein